MLSLQKEEVSKRFITNSRSVLKNELQREFEQMAFETSAGTDGLGSRNNLPRHLEPDLTLKNRNLRKSNASCIYCERQETNKGSWFASAIFMYVDMLFVTKFLFTS